MYIIHITGYSEHVLLNSYTMATRDLPDIYAQARGPQARGRGHIYIYIKQIPSGHVYTTLVCSPNK